MKRDWLTYGRRPTGLCGAAILMAARMHNFKRSIHQIVETVHVCDETIRKRVQEFSNTSVAALTSEEFEAIKDKPENEIEYTPMDPPSFTRGLTNNKALMKLKNIEETIIQTAQKIDEEHKRRTLNQQKEIKFDENNSEFGSSEKFDENEEEIPEIPEDIGRQLVQFNEDRVVKKVSLIYIRKRKMKYYQNLMKKES